MSELIYLPCSTTLLVPGSTFSILINTEKNKVYRFKNTLLKKNNFNVNCSRGQPSSSIEFNDFLTQKELFFSLKPEDRHLFPDYGSTPSNGFLSHGDVILCIGKQTVIDEKYLEFLLSAYSKGFKIVQLQIHAEANVDAVINIIHKFISFEISFEILVECSEDIELKLLRLMEKFHSVYKLSFFFSPKSYRSIDEYGRILEYSKKPLVRSSCGYIDVKRFVPTLQFVNFTRKQNSCLSNKITIDENGNFKNCPSMKGVFGNIKTTTLENLLKKEKFTEAWNLSKDDIQVCKDCEYRYICTDCRAYLQSPNNNSSKPLKCGYNPYLGKWANWRENPLSTDAINYYQL